MVDIWNIKIFSLSNIVVADALEISHQAPGYFPKNVYRTCTVYYVERSSSYKQDLLIT